MPRARTVAWPTPRGQLLPSIRCHAFQLGIGKLAQGAPEMLPRDCKPILAIAIQRLNGALAGFASMIEIVCESLLHLFSLDCVSDKNDHDDCDQEGIEARNRLECFPPFYIHVVALSSFKHSQFTTLTTNMQRVAYDMVQCVKHRPMLAK
jgi:hypothetical protein